MTEAATAETTKGPGRTPKRPALRDRLRGAKRMDTNTSDRFHIPDDVRMRHDGVSLEWKRFSLYGQEDPFYINNHRRQGWEPMTADDFPELVPENHNGPIIKDGMILMGRPQELTDQARAEQSKAARGMIKDRERQLGIKGVGEADRIAPTIDKQLMRAIPIED